MAAQEQEQGLTLWTLKSQALSTALTPESVRQFEVALGDAPEARGLTVERIALDFCAMMNSNPKIALVAKGPGVWGCMMNACRYQTTFGDGGLWVIPDADNPGGIRTQESRKFQMERAKELRGVDEYNAVRIYKIDEPVKVQRSLIGEILDFTLSTENFTGDRPLPELRGVFVVVTFTDRRKTRIDWWPKAELDRLRDHSQSFKSGKASMWKDDPEAAYDLAAKAATARKLAPVRTLIPGMAGDVFGGEAIEASYTEVGTEPLPDFAEGAADELLARGSEPAPENPAGAEGSGPPPPPPTPPSGSDDSPLPDSLQPLVAPTIEQLPPELGKVAGEPTSVVSRAFKALAKAAAELPANPLGIKDCWEENSRQWGQEAEKADGKHLTAMRMFFFTWAAEVGFSQAGK